MKKEKKDEKKVKVMFFEHYYSDRVVHIAVDLNDGKTFRVAIAVKDPADKYDEEFVKKLLVARLEKRRKNGSYFEVSLSKVLDKYTEFIAQKSAKNAARRAKVKNALHSFNDTAILNPVNYNGIDFTSFFNDEFFKLFSGIK